MGGSWDKGLQCSSRGGSRQTSMCKAVIAARRRSVPSEGKRQAEESLALCLDVLVSGALMRLRLRLSRATTLV